MSRAQASERHHRLVSRPWLVLSPVRIAQLPRDAESHPGALSLIPTPRTVWR
jgi:hypothetical protein